MDDVGRQTGPRVTGSRVAGGPAAAELKLAAARPRPAPAGHSGVVVLGVQCGGSGDVAEVFVSAGFVAGANHASTTGAGPALGDFDEALLAAAGGSWDNPPTGDDLALDSAESRGRVLATFDRLREQAAGAPLVLDDPPLGVLLSVWWPALEGVMDPVVVIRRPLDSAWALARRDGMSITAALALWETYTTATLGALHGRPARLVRYESLLDQPQLAVDLVSEVTDALDPDRTEAVRRLEVAEVTDILGAGLRPLPSASARLSDFATMRQQALWELVSGWSNGHNSLDVPEEFRAPSAAAMSILRQDHRSRRELNRLREELDAATTRSEELAGSQVHLEARILELEASVSTAMAQLDSSAIEKDQRGRRITDLESEIYALAQRSSLVDEIEARLGAVEKERDRLRGVATETMNELRAQTALTAKATRHRVRLAAQKVELEALTAELARNLSMVAEDLRAARSSETWRAGRVVTAPLRWMKAPFRRRS